MSKFTNEQLSTIIELWKDSCISSIVTSNYEKFKTMADAFNVIYPNACVSGKRIEYKIQYLKKIFRS